MFPQAFLNVFQRLSKVVRAGHLLKKNKTILEQISNSGVNWHCPYIFILTFKFWILISYLHSWLKRAICQLASWLLIFQNLNDFSDLPAVAANCKKIYAPAKMMARKFLELRESLFIWDSKHWLIILSKLWCLPLEDALFRDR